MDKILTTFTPALILLFIAVVTRYFPPTKGNAFLIKGPQSWAKDEDIWNKAYQYLAKRYAVYGILLTFCCGLIYFLDWKYADILGYIVLILLVILAQYQARKYMKGKDT